MHSHPHRLHPQKENEEKHEKEKKRMKNSKHIFALVALVVATGIAPAFGQTVSVKPDTLRIEFPLGSSVISAKYNSKIADAKEKIAAGWIAEIYGGANEVAWGDSAAWADSTMSVNQSDALNGGKITTRNRAVAKALGLASCKVGVLTAAKKAVVVVLVPPQLQPATKGEVNDLGDEVNNLGIEVKKIDEKVDILDHDVDQALMAINARIDSLKRASAHQARWSLITGWQGVSFGNRRDLSVASAGLRFSTGPFYAEVGGGLDPEAKPGYDNAWFRDYLATARLGAFFWKKIALEIGGLGGWEATSDTKPNSFVMQVLGITAGLKGEVSVTNIGPVNISAHAGASFVYAEVNDVLARIAPMRKGIAGSAGATITF
jgi:hypothetical protein